MRAALPAALKQALLDDWQRASEAAPAPLPRKPCVDAILQRYLDRAPGSLDGPGLEESVSWFMGGSYRVFGRFTCPHAVSKLAVWRVFRIFLFSRSR